MQYIKILLYIMTIGKWIDKIRAKLKKNKEDNVNVKEDRDAISSQ